MTGDPSAPAAQVGTIVADDHPMFRASIERVVQGHQQLRLLATVSKAAEAVAACGRLTPGLLLVDLNFPDGTGFDVIDEVASLEVSPLVVLLAGTLSQADAYRAIERGASGIFTKLVESDVLAEGLTGVLAGRTVLGHEAQELLVGAVKSRRKAQQALLSAREREVLERIAQGEKVIEIGLALHLSPSTIKTHLESSYRKLGVSDRSAAVAVAIRTGLIE